MGLTTQRSESGSQGIRTTEPSSAVIAIRSLSESLMMKLTYSQVVSPSCLMNSLIMRTTHSDTVLRCVDPTKDKACPLMARYAGAAQNRDREMVCLGSYGNPAPFWTLPR